MAKAGRIYHWKHGWIPLDQALTVDQKRAELNKRRAARGEAPLLPRKSAAAKGPKVTFEAVAPKKGMDELRREAIAREMAKTPDQIRAEERAAAATDKARRAAAEARSSQYRKVDTVDGVEFVSYKSSNMDPLGDDHGQPWEMDEAQKQVVADAYNEVRAEFPGMKPVQIVATQGKEGILGITTWDGRRISLSENAFSDAQRRLAARNFGEHGAIVGQYTDDPEAFARATVVHELGHALEMQTAEAKRRGDALALEKVTPSQVGVDTSSWAPDAAKEKTQRWQIDTLNQQTVYGLGNQFEWFAEAFAEGWFNGDKATPQGKKALAILKDVYGKKTAA